MLYAIAVYRRDEIKTIEKVDYAYQGSNNPINNMFKPYNPLPAIKEVILNALLNDNLENGRIYCYYINGKEPCYLKIDGELIRAIVSKKELDNTEAHYLMINSRSIPLNAIIANPIGYTGNDVTPKKNQQLWNQKVDNVKQKNEETKKAALMAIDKIILRGQRLDELTIRAEDLNSQADKFKDEAIKQNACCSYF